MKNLISRMIVLGLTLPMLGAGGCLPTGDQIRTSAIANAQDFINALFTTAVGNIFANLTN